jgi:hypothetical protein
MPRYRFAWSNLNENLLRSVAERLGIFTANPYSEIEARYGIRPNEKFIHDAWPSLLEFWLRDDQNVCYQIAKALREANLGKTMEPNDLDYLYSCNNTKTLRRVALAKFIELGEPHYLKSVEQSAAAGTIPVSSTSTNIMHKGSIRRKEVENIVYFEKKANPATALKTIISASPNPQVIANRKGEARSRIIGISSAAIALGIGLVTLSKITYANTVKLGEQDHVSSLLALSDSPSLAEKNLEQLNQFRLSNWRYYLSDKSLKALNSKGVVLHRALEIRKLEDFINRYLKYPVSEANVNLISSQIRSIQDSSAYKFLDEASKSLVNSRQDSVNAIQQQNATRTAAEEKKTKEAAELAERARVQEQIRNAQVAQQEQAAQAEASRQAGSSYSQTSGSTSGYQIGPRGGCYYWTGSRKVYVDHSNCN